MRPSRSVPAVLTTLAVALGLALVVPGGSSAHPSDALVTTSAGVPVVWRRHVARYAGPLSAQLRDQMGGTAVEAAPRVVGPSTAAAPATRGSNRQVGTDTEPPVRQSNPAVVASLDDPETAVAAMNDAASLGYQLLRTTDGGRTWTSVTQVPQLPDGEQCSVQTPSLAYSRRDHAFDLAVYCGTADGASSVQVWTSRDGTTWTAPRYAATAATNVDPVTGLPDPDVLYSWDTIAVDNDPASPHYGRLYLAWSRYHLLPSGESDACPAQVAWTDRLAALPSDTTFTVTPVGPAGGTPDGVGASTSAWTRIATQPDGDVLVVDAQEDCNTALDRHVRAARSTDGGVSFSDPESVDRPGQFADNPDLDDVLPGKSAPLGISPSLAVSPATGRAEVVYQNNVSPTSGADIWVSSSLDGVHWRGQPLTAAPQDQFFSSIASDPRGRLWALWLDDRRDPADHLVDAWEATSSDDGATWRSRRISTTSYDPDDTSSLGSSLGVVTGIAASTRAVYPMWPDARDNDVVRTGVPDLDVWTDVERLSGGR